MTHPREPFALERSAPIFAALGDPTRLKLVARLAQSGPHSIARLTRGTTFTRQAITKHLHVLNDAGLVRGSRLGRESHWEVVPQQLEAAHKYLDLISKKWDAALRRLQQFVEE